MTLDDVKAHARHSLHGWLHPDWVARVDARSLRLDLNAGVLGAVLVLPQALAFAALAGVPPEYGLLTAIVPCIVAALAGSSWHVMSGPTNANSLALFALLLPFARPQTPEFLELAFALTAMVGLFQWLIGALRIGTVANFISPTALLGFTCGAAVLIAWHALLGLLPAHAAATQGATGAGADAGAAAAAAAAQAPGAAAVVAGFVIALTAIVVAVVLRRRWPRGPYLLAGLVAAGVLAWLVQRLWPTLPVPTLGAVPFRWPSPHLPAIDPGRIPELLGPASALTVIGLAQSISIAKAIASRSGQRIDPNREFIGQGLSNLIGGFSQCFVSCGSLNRSVPNFEAGARTPLAAVFAALLLLPTVLLAAPLLAHIPDAAISGLLMVVAWTLFDHRRLRALWHESRSEFTVAAVTLAATLALRLEVAVLIGSAMSLGLFLYRTSRPALRTMGFDRDDADRRFVILEQAPAALPECPQLKLLRMEGSVYFGASAHVSDRLQALRDAEPVQKHLLVMAKSMNFIDVAGADLWRDELAKRRAIGGDLYFHRPRPDVMDAWRRSRFLDRLGAGHLFASKEQAIAAITQRLDPDVCAGCRVRLFRECADRPGGAGIRSGAQPQPAFEAPPEAQSEQEAQPVPDARP